MSGRPGEVRNREEAVSAALRMDRLFGGTDGILNDPAEVTPQAARYFEGLHDLQDGVLDEIVTRGRINDTFFRNDLVGKFHVELRKLNDKDATRALRQIYYHSYSQNNNELPPFVSILDAGSADEGRKLPVEFRFIFMFVNHGGFSLPVVIKRDQLEGFENPEITVDGYVDSMLVVGGGNFQTSINGKMWKITSSKVMKEAAAKGELKISGKRNAPSGKIAPEWPKFFQKSLSSEAIASLRFYFSTDFYDDLFYIGALPRAFGSKDSFRIGLNGFEIQFKQEGLRRIAEEGPGDSGKSIGFYLQGRPCLLTGAEDVEDRLRRIYLGISEVENLFRVRPIRNVNILSSQIDNIGIRFKDDSSLIMSTSFLLRSEPETLRYAARHEVLHSITYRAGLPKAESIVEYFGGTLGGEVGFHSFLRFIGEDNIFRMGGVHGHAFSNVYEFCASFTHSILDTELLAERFLELPTDKRDEFLDHYLRLTELFAAESGIESVREFYQDRHWELMNLKK